MTAVTELPLRPPLTKADLADRPDDGHRYELLDGVLIVTPAPSLRHQDAALSLAVRLREACPPELKVLMAPFDVTLADDTVLQPDVLVFDRKLVTARDLPAAPLLAIEVLSPSTRRFDLHLKRSRYEAAGTAAYWVVDPGEPPVLTAWELRAGAYVGGRLGVRSGGVRRAGAVPGDRGAGRAGRSGLRAVSRERLVVIGADAGGMTAAPRRGAGGRRTTWRSSRSTAAGTRRTRPAASRTGSAAR